MNSLELTHNNYLDALTDETEFKIEFNIEEYREKALRIELKSKRVLENIKIQSTKIKSEARELIESFPITNENYPLAIESLVERYGRNELIDFYVRELLKLVLNNATKKKQDSLSGLYNKLSTQLRALSSLAEELGFNLQREEEFRHSLFGGTKTRMYKHKCYKIYLSSLDGNYICKLDALNHVIFNDISSARNGSWIHELKTKNIFLTDIQENTGPIEVILGADVAGKLITGQREELKTGLVALETKLGCTLMGKVPRYTDKKDTSMNIVTMLSQEHISVSSLWDLEMLGIRDTIEQNSREEKEKAVMSHFLETVRQKEDGRYEVHMPWKVDRAFLTDNYELCLKRLESTTRKLEKIGFREKYHEVFREWLAEGVIEEIPGKELPVRTHYLPHRPVIKETSASSSMKIRPVFDASAKINNHPSLNDCLETGNNLIESVPAILARFRLKPIGVISDIRRAFLQISLHEKDRDFVRFLWYDNEGNIRTYRHARVAFGVTSSPFLLMAVINYHLLKESVKERYSEEFLKNYKIVFMSIIA
ncbi:integrase catalytic domain-containing protein [Trichonephila clavipes]|nr:integrase catalytic domain-containing protein [Trichonephila clavipes]